MGSPGTQISLEPMTKSWWVQAPACAYPLCWDFLLCGCLVFGSTMPVLAPGNCFAWTACSPLTPWTAGGWIACTPCIGRPAHQHTCFLPSWHVWNPLPIIRSLLSPNQTLISAHLIQDSLRSCPGRTPTRIHRTHHTHSAPVAVITSSPLLL